MIQSTATGPAVPLLLGVDKHRQRIEIEPEGIGGLTASEAEQVCIQ